VLLQVGNERFDSHHSYDKRNYRAYPKVDKVIAAHGHEFVAFHFCAVHVPVLQYHRVACSRRHSRHRQEEGELCRYAAGKLLLHTPNDGCRAAANPRYHGQALPQTYYKATLQGDVFFFYHCWIFESFINKEQYDAADYQHGGYGHRAFQQLFYCIVEQETQCQRGYYGYRQFYVKVQPGFVKELFPVQHHYGKYRAQLNAYLKHLGKGVILDTHQVAGEYHMPGG